MRADLTNLCGGVTAPAAFCDPRVMTSSPERAAGGPEHAAPGYPSFAPVAQLDRARGSEPRGRGFDSLRAQRRSGASRRMRAGRFPGGRSCGAAPCLANCAGAAAPAVFRGVGA